MGGCVSTPKSRRQNSSKQPLGKIFQLDFNKPILCGSADEGINQSYWNLIDRNEEVVQPYNNQPYRCIGRVVAGHLEIQQQNQNNLPFGTGFLIHPRIVMTSAHNIFTKEINKFPDQLFFIIQSGKQHDDNIIRVERYAIPEQYFDNDLLVSKKYDIALLILQQSKFITPNMCLKIQYNSEVIPGNNSTSYMISGYPKMQSLNLPKILQWKGQIEITQFNQNFINYTHITGPGYSGSPIIKIQYTEFGPSYIAIGVHKGQTASGQGYAISFNAQVKSLFNILQNLQQNIIQNMQDNANKIKLNQFLKILYQEQLLAFKHQQNHNKNIKKYFSMQKLFWSRQLERKTPFKGFIRANKNQNSYQNFFNRLQKILNREQKYMILTLATWKFLFGKFKSLILNQKQTIQLFQIFYQLSSLNKGNNLYINQINQIQKIAKRIYDIYSKTCHKTKFFMLRNSFNFTQNLSQDSLQLRDEIQKILRQNINQSIYEKRLQQKNMRQMKFYLNFNLLTKAFQFADQSFDKGQILLKLKSYQTALKCFLTFQQDVKISQRSKRDQANAKFYIARTYKLLQENKNALKFYQQCLKLDKEMYGEKSYQYTSTLNNIGNIHEAMGNYKTALEYYQNSLNIKDKIQKISNTNIVISLFNIAGNYTKLKNYDTALQKYNHALSITTLESYADEKQQNKVESYHIYNAIGQLYKQQNKFNLSLQNYLKCIQILKRINNRSVRQNLVRVYFAVSFIYQKENNLHKAKQYMKQSYELSVTLFTQNHVQTKKIRNQYQQLQKL